ncbi:MAG: DUF1565 domain-containing protein [Bacteroidales bacterium]|nr:DUF1565 domain-containing protein [Bacteroidales bacterium]
MTNVRKGIQGGENNYVANTGNISPVWSGNSIQSFKIGIWNNLVYGSASPVIIDGNTITTVPGSSINSGIEISSIQGDRSVVITNNNVVSAMAGVNLWSNNTSSTVTVEASNTFTNCAYGVFANNYDGYNSNGESSIYILDGCSITNPTLAGVYVKDNNLNTSNSSVSVIVRNNTSISGSAAGMKAFLVEGADASLSFVGVQPQASIIGAPTYISLQSNGTNVPTGNIDATKVLYDALYGMTMSNAELFAVEDKIDHKIENRSLGFVNVKANNAFVTDVTSPTAVNNDYTRMRNAVDMLSNNWSLNLHGTFDFAETNAAASWALGNDDISGNDDDYTLYIPTGISGGTITAPEGLGFATIQGPGDLAAANLEGFLGLWGGSYQNWTISNLEIFDFDLGIGMFYNGVNDFNNTVVTNNHIRIATDLNTTVAPADVNQNIGIHYAFGTNQTISNNIIDIYGDGVSDGINYSTSAAMQSNTSGGSVYNGLNITGNTINVLNAQSTNPQVILGIWENGHAHTSNITISGNQFNNLAVGNNPVTNLQRAFRVTSHSGASSTVSYVGNTINGANIGFQWIAGSDFSSQQPVTVSNNILNGNNTAFLLQSNGKALFTANDLDDATDNNTDMQIVSGVATSGGGNQFAGDSWYVNNQGANGFNISADLFDNADNFRRSDLIYDALDNVASGLVRFNNTELYVSAPATGGSDETIQRAVDAGASGDIVNVEAGSFVENVTVGKRLEIKGAGNTTIVQGIGSTGNVFTYLASASGTGSSVRSKLSNMKLTGAARGIYVDQLANYVSVEAVAFDYLTNYGVHVNNTSGTINDWAFNNCTFTGNPVGLHVGTSANINTASFTGCAFTNNTSQGIYSAQSSASPGGFNNVEISNCSFTGNGNASNLSAFYFEKLSNALISGNTFTNNGPAANPRAMIINLKYASYSNVTITGNTLLESRGAATNGYGMFIAGRNDGSYASPPASLGNLTIANNELSGFRNGIGFENNVDWNSTTVLNNKITNCYSAIYGVAANSGQTLNIHDNDLSGSVAAFIANGVAGNTINATCNWFGTTAGNSIAPKIFGTVTYSPWYVSGADGAGIGFQPSGSCLGTPVLITLATPTHIYCGDPSGSIQVTFTGGTGPFNITWTGGSATNITSPYTINGLAANTYTITVTDANGSFSTYVPVTVQYLPVANSTDNLFFPTIQSAIDASTTANGEILTVCAGTYAEDIIVTKSLDIRGPNYGITPNGGSRVAEAVIHPATSSKFGEIIKVKTSDVKIDGLTIDGDNPLLVSGLTGTNSADVDAAEAITVYVDNVNNLKVTNNIITNLTYFGVTLFGGSYSAPATTGNEISNNLIKDLGIYSDPDTDPNLNMNYWGGGVLLYNNQYTKVANNNMSNVRMGLQTGNFSQANPGASTYQVIDNNTIQARRRGIFHNLHYGSTSAYTLSNNNIIGLMNSNETVWDGILLASLSVPATCSNNSITATTITNPSEGYEIWNVMATSPSTITGGNVTGVATGVFANNYEGYNGDTGDGAHASVTNLTIVPKATGIGIRILDSPSSLLHGKVNLTLTGNTINGGLEGIKFEETQAGTVGGSVISNNINSYAVGIDVTGLKTDSPNGLTIQNNVLNFTSQMAGTNPTVGILLANISGNQAASVSNNNVTGAWYGFMLYNINTTPVTSINGGTLSGLMQGVAAVNINPFTGMSFAASTFDLNNISMSGFAGDHTGVPALEGRNFHAGVYIFTGGNNPSDKITANLNNLSVSSTGKIAGDCAGLSFADFSTGTGNRQNITVNGSTINNNLNRGINVRGANALVNVNASFLTGNGFDPYGLGGNVGFGIISREAAVVNVENTFITNPATVTSPYKVEALFTDPGTSSTATINAHDNSLDNNGNTSGYLAGNVAGATLDASCNWWGSASASAVAAVMDPASTSPVAYLNWLNTGTDNDGNSATGFQPVPGACTGPTEFYVNDNSNTGDRWCTGTGSDLNAGTTAAPLATLTKALAFADAGDVIYIDAGAYVENVNVNKSVTINGPNMDIDPTVVPSIRLAEAVIAPAVNDPVNGRVFDVTANNVTINGVTVDGDNLGLSGGLSNNGADINAQFGIGSGTWSSGSGGKSGMIVKYNVVKNTNDGGIYGNAGATPAEGGLFTYNRIDNSIWWGIVMENNCYTDITYNKITRVSRGIQYDNYWIAKSSGSSLIANNDITYNKRGILQNLFYSSGSAFQINNNTLSVSSSPEIANVGLVYWSIASGITATATNNIINAGEQGIRVWNCQGNVSVNGGVVNGGQYGILSTTTDAYGNGAVSNATFNNITLLGGSASGDIGVKVYSHLSSLSSSIQVTNNCSISGYDKGVDVDGSAAAINLNNNLSTITGNDIGVNVGNGGSAAVVNNTISNNNTGIYVATAGNLTSCTGNTITNNNSMGIQINSDAGSIAAIVGNKINNERSFILSCLWNRSYCRWR